MGHEKLVAEDDRRCRGEVGDSKEKLLHSDDVPFVNGYTAD